MSTGGVVGGTSWTAHTAVVVAVLGAAWFCLLSLAATVAYTPVGVRPDEIGMDAVTLLTQAVAGLIVTLVLLALLGLVAALFVGKQLSAPSSGSSTVVTLALATIAFAFIILLPAKDAADRLEAGEKGRDRLFWIPLPDPWSPEVVEVSWAHSSPVGPSSSLPSCALYLGQANGTSVLYDAKLKRTWRVPSSELVIRGTPSANHCP